MSLRDELINKSHISALMSSPLAVELAELCKEMVNEGHAVLFEQTEDGNGAIVRVSMHHYRTCLRCTKGGEQ